MSISKQEAVDILKGMGYDSFLRDGVVMVAKENPTTFSAELSEILRKMGYRNSFGVTIRNATDGMTKVRGEDSYTGEE